MAGQRSGEDKPVDLVAEAQGWLDWNTRVFAASHSPQRATELAARISPSPERVAALLGRAQTTHALLSHSPPPRDDELVAIHAAACRFFQARLTGSWVPGYLASRGMRAVFLPASPWKTGYAPKAWTALTDHLRGRGFGEEALLRSGLVTTGRNGGLRDRFHDRLMIPVRSPEGAVIAFTGRRHPDATDAQGPKYLNSPDTPLYTKGHVLVGLAEGRRQLDLGAQPVLVEGPLDAIAVSIAAPGRYTGVTPCGTALTGEQAAALARAVDLPGRGVRIALDADTAGRKAAVRAYAQLRPVASEMTAVVFPDGRDPAGMLENDGRDGLRAALTGSVRPLADLVVDACIEQWASGRDLQFAEQQLGAIRAAADVIAGMPGGEVGPQALRLADRFGWPAQDITREVIEAVERHYQAPAHQGRGPATKAGRWDPLTGLPAAMVRLIRNASAPAREGQVPGAQLETGADAHSFRHGENTRVVKRSGQARPVRD